MAKIFKEYQGETVRVGGVCYTFVEETTESVNTSPNVIEGTFASCLECTIEESSSQSSESIDNFSSSTSSFNYSESTSESSEGYTTSSSTSSESFNNFSSSTSSEMFSDVTSSSSESILNTSSSSESDANFSSSQSDGCVSMEILDILTPQKLLVFAPGPPLLNLAEGQVCVNGIDIGLLDTGQSSNAIYFSTLGITNNYSIGEVVEVCEGECCYKGNYTKRCIYERQEDNTSQWELVSSDNQRTNACDLDFKCGLENQVYQIHQFETLEQRNNFVCPFNPIGDVPSICNGDFSSSSSSDPQSESSSSSAGAVNLTCNCPGPVGAPKMALTISWTDLDISKSFFGCSWANGETKDTCPTTYNCAVSTINTTDGGYGFNTWNMNIGPYSETLELKGYRYGYYHVDHQKVKGKLNNGTATWDRHKLWYPWPGFASVYTYPHASAGVGSTSGITAANFTLGHTIKDNLFGSITTTGGVTISWGRGGDSWACS